MKITLTESLKIQKHEAQRRKLKRLVRSLLVERASLKQQILELLAADTASQAKVKAAFEKSEVIEARMRVVAGTPAV